MGRERRGKKQSSTNNRPRRRQQRGTKASANAWICYVMSVATMMLVIRFAWIYSRGSDAPVDQMNILETFTRITMLRGQHSANNSASDLNSALSSIAAQQQRNSHSLNHLSERLITSLQPKLGPSVVPPASPLYPAKPKESALETSTMPASVGGHSSSLLLSLSTQQALKTVPLAKNRANTGLVPSRRNEVMLETRRIEHCLLLSRTLKVAPACGDKRRELDIFPLLVTGMGRSGTAFTYKMLKARGFDFAHDDMPVGRHGAASWILAIRESPQDGSVKIPFAFPSFATLDKSFMGAAPKARFNVVVHQVRNPLKAIVSRANRIGMMFAPIKYSNPDMFKELARGTTAVISYPPDNEMAIFRAEKGNKNWTPKKRLRVALWHYVLWNEWLHAWADYTLKVEDLSGAQHLMALCGLIGNNAAKACAQSPSTSISTKTNAHEYMEELKGVTWANLSAITPFMADRARALGESYGYASV